MRIIVSKRAQMNRSPLIANHWQTIKSVTEMFEDRKKNLQFQDQYLDEVNRFIDLSFNKALILYTDALSLIEANRLLSSSMIARSGLEVVCTIIEFYRKLKASLQRKDLDNFKSTLRNFSFSNLEFTKNIEVTPPNVMNAIRTVGKIKSMTLQTYSTLCETVHPNWSGLAVIDAKYSLEDNPVTLRLFLAISYAVNLLDTLIEETRDFDEFLRRNMKNYKAMILQ